MSVFVQEAQKWKPLTFDKVKNDLVWRGLEVIVAYAIFRCMVSRYNAVHLILNMSSNNSN